MEWKIFLISWNIFVDKSDLDSFRYPWHLWTMQRMYFAINPSLLIDDVSFRYLHTQNTRMPGPHWNKVKYMECLEYGVWSMEYGIWSMEYLSVINWPEELQRSSGFPWDYWSFPLLSSASLFTMFPTKLWKYPHLNQMLPTIFYLFFLQIKLTSCSCRWDLF